MLDMNTGCSKFQTKPIPRCCRVRIIYRTTSKYSARSDIGNTHMYRQHRPALNTHTHSTDKLKDEQRVRRQLLIIY